MTFNHGGVTDGFVDDRGTARGGETLGTSGFMGQDLDVGIWRLCKCKSAVCS